MAVRDVWVGPILERHLGQVAAPEELWQRVRAGKRAAPRMERRGWDMLVPIAAAACLIAGVLTYWHRPVSREALAVAALQGDPQDLELRSDTAGEIRVWVKKKTGLDLPLPESAPECIRMSGACSVKGNRPMVEVAYRMNGRNAVMLVSKATGMPDDRQHRFLKSESVGGARVSSWVMRGQLYTLAFAGGGDAREECRLCHESLSGVM